MEGLMEIDIFSSQSNPQWMYFITNYFKITIKRNQKETRKPKVTSFVVI